MPLVPLLQRFVDDELARAPALIEQTIGDTVELLRGAKDSGLAAAERSMQTELIEALQRHTPGYRAAFVESLQSRVAAELARQDGGSGMAPPSGLGGLSLMDESRVDIDIEVSRATQLIDAATEWELRELQTFTSTLIGQAHVTADSNPLRPMLYSTALWDAGCVVFSSHPHRAALLRAAATACAGLLKKAWAAASSRLEQQGVTPSIYRTVVLAGGSSAAAPQGPPPASRAVPTASITQLLSAMPAGREGRIGAGGGGAGSVGARSGNAEGSGGGRTGATGAGGDGSGADRSRRGDRGHAGLASVRTGSRGGPAPIHGPAFEQALLRLDEILRQLPSHAIAKAEAAALGERMSAHRATLAASVDEPRQRQVIVLLSRVFDAMLADPELHPLFVALVSRLQISALRVARRDASIVESTQHPMWQLLDRIGEASSSYPAPSDSRCLALRSLCQRLANELTRSTASDGDLYRKALTRLDEFLGAQLQAQLRAAEHSVQHLREAEKVQALQQVLTQRLVEQMRPLRPSPTVRRFVSGSWSRVLATAILRFGEEAQVTKGYVRLVDDLLWSVQLPDHPASRQRLAGLLPGLLQRLRSGMALIALPGAEQQTILDELMTLHTAAPHPRDRPEADNDLRRPFDDGHGSQQGQNVGFAAQPPRGAEPTAEQIVQALRDDTALPALAAASAAVEPLIELGSMQTVPAELMASDAAADVGSDDSGAAQRVALLYPPQRQRMFVNGRWSAVQLLWRSDDGHYFLFAGESPAQTHSITRSALERLAGAGLLRPLETRSLSQRALDSVRRQLALGGSRLH